MFVGSPIPYIQATDLNQAVFLGLFQDAFCKSARAEPREECQNVKTSHTRFSLYLSIASAPPFARLKLSQVAGVQEANTNGVEQFHASNGRD